MSPVPQPAVGAIPFQCLAEIAVGATARVDLCRAVAGAREGQLLAVKRLHAHIAQDPAFANMFLDEVWMTAALKHPNVVEVAGWGADAQGTYLAVELVQGVSLARLMKTVFDTGEVFSERMVVFVASQLCAGLAAAHALRSPEGELLNLVHRDLTPGNVLVSFNGDVKIADFGLAKAKQRVTKTLTGLLKGKPQYMSPEQARGQEIDGRADLFSLGVLLFELFAGRRPWSATSELQMMHVTANEPPLDLRECRPKIDRELVAIVTRCLEKEPAARFQSAAEIGQRLVGWLSAHGYMEGNEEALGRFVRRNAMRQMRWFERAVGGELAPMPDSLRPPRLDPPRVPSYTSITNPPASKGAPRARVKPRRAPDAETTDVTDAESKVAALHVDSAPPLILEAGQPPADVDWGEEIPTLVQRSGSSQVSDLARARVRPRPSVPKMPGAIFDEDSDARTTDVKKRQREEADELVSTRKRPPHRQAVVDLESEEHPTVPLQGRTARRAAVDHAFAASPLPGAIVPPSAGVPPIPRQPGSALPPPPLAPRDVGLGLLPAPTSAPDPALGSGVRAPTSAPDPAPPLELSRDATPSSPISGIHSAAERVSEELLLAEADRLALEAVRLNEEAKSAAAHAVRKATMAKLAGDAAMIAAEAVRIAGSAGLSLAARRLEEARALEATIRRGELSPSAFPPPSAQAPRVATAPLPQLLAAQSSPPSQAHGERPSIPAPRISVAPVSRDEAARLAALETGPLGQPSELYASDFGGRAAAYDEFRSRLQPTLLGLPAAVAVAFGAVALVIVVLLVWIAIR